MAMLIPLTRQKYAIVDDADYEWLAQYSWCAVEGKLGHFYAQTRAIVGYQSDGTPIFKTREMQRMILDPDDVIKTHVFADHKNHDTQDNCRSNLRWLTRQENAIHRRSVTNMHGYKGVYFNKARGKYGAKATINGKTHAMCRFDTPEEAALAVNELLLKHHGELAVLNVIKAN